MLNAHKGIMIGSRKRRVVMRRRRTKRRKEGKKFQNDLLLLLARRPFPPPSLPPSLPPYRQVFPLKICILDINAPSHGLDNPLVQSRGCAPLYLCTRDIDVGELTVSECISLHAPA